MRLLRLLALYLLLAAPASVRGDEVQLRGGTKIEGKARREGDSVVIRVESGEIRLPADSVEQIRKAESSEDVAARKRAALAPRDVRGRMELAAYCREHELRATERALLQEVIEIEPNHATARRLLGYERDETGRAWVDRSRQRQEARVAEEAAWLERQREHQREQARIQAERDQQKAEAEAQRAREEEQRRAREAEVYAPVYYGYPWWGYGHYPHPRPHPTPHCRDGRDCPPSFPIAGVRHPRDTSFFLPGVKDPRESLR